MTSPSPGSDHLPRGMPLWAQALIVGALLGILWIPAQWFRGQLAMVDGIRCHKHMLQLAIGVRMYAEDYDHRTPFASNWCEATYPYVKNYAVFSCTAVGPVGENEEGAAGYAYNAAQAGARLDRLRGPEQVPMLFDSRLGG